MSSGSHGAAFAAACLTRPTTHLVQRATLYAGYDVVVHLDQDPSTKMVTAEHSMASRKKRIANHLSPYYARPMGVLHTGYDGHDHQARR